MLSNFHRALRQVSARKRPTNSVVYTTPRCYQCMQTRYHVVQLKERTATDIAHNLNSDKVVSSWLSHQSSKLTCPDDETMRAAAKFARCHGLGHLRLGSRPAAVLVQAIRGLLKKVTDTVNLYPLVPELQEVLGRVTSHATQIRCGALKIFPSPGSRERSLLLL